MPETVVRHLKHCSRAIEPHVSYQADGKTWRIDERCRCGAVGQRLYATYVDAERALRTENARIWP